MHFLPDVYVPCQVCKGKGYNRETLEVKYKGKSISDVLEMTIEEAVDFFRPIPEIFRKLETLLDVGLGYVRMGQPATVWLLSGRRPSPTAPGPEVQTSIVMYRANFPGGRMRVTKPKDRHAPPAAVDSPP